MAQNRRTLLIYICIGIAFISCVSLAAAFYLVGNNSGRASTPNTPVPTSSINSFEECAEHYPIMESYPEQCATPDGKHFTKQY